MRKNRTLNMAKKMMFTFCATTALVTVSYAQKPGGEKRTPPQEAIDICKGLDTGAECTMTTPRGDSVTGTCENTPDNKYFACKPEGGPGGERPDRN